MLLRRKSSIFFFFFYGLVVPIVIYPPFDYFMILLSFVDSKSSIRSTTHIAFSRRYLESKAIISAASNMV